MLGAGEIVFIHLVEGVVCPQCRQRLLYGDGARQRVIDVFKNHNRIVAAAFR